MTDHWNMASASWDAAGRTSRNYRTRVRKMHAAVGDPRNNGAIGLRDGHDGAHHACGHHVCSCVFGAPPSAAACEPVPRAFKVGDRVVVAGRKGFLDALSQMRGDAAWWVTTDCGPRYLLPERDIKHEPEAPTPGTFAWLKTLPPETMVRRRSWDHRQPYSVRCVLYHGYPSWLSATDWELA